MPVEIGRVLTAHYPTASEAITLWGRAFPFSFILDHQLVITSSGPLLRRLCPEVQGQVALTHCFTSPHFGEAGPDFTQISLQAGQLVMLRRVADASMPPLRGQFLALSEEALLFLGWPWLKSFGELSALGMTLDDIPAHNPLAEMLMLLQTNRSAMSDARDLANALKQRSRVLEQLNVQLKDEIDERRRAECAMAAARQLAEVTLESISDGVIVTDPAGLVTTLNAAAQRLTTYTLEVALGHPVGAIFTTHMDAAGAGPSEVLGQVLSGEKPSGIVRNTSLRLPDGGLRELEYTVSLIQEQAGVVMVLRDVSEARKLTRDLAHQAFHDALTGLPNRLMLRERLHHALHRAARDQQHLAVLFIDLDRFKSVNDTLGHRVGDELLRACAVRLCGALRRTDTVAREGGDEFVILLEQIKDVSHAADVAHKLLAAMNMPYEVEGHTLHCSASIGVSFYPEDSQDVEGLIKHADAAMLESKRDGRNSVQFFSHEICQRTMQRIALEAELRLALAHDQFVVYYQPQVALPAQRIDGAEALIRWCHPQRGMVPPLEFIPLAEEMGLIVQIGEWVLDRVCRQIADWLTRFGRSPPVSVNVSARQLQLPDFALRVESILQRYGIPSNLIKLELTEHSLLRQHDEASVLLARLKKQGVQLVLDDFGTGYSNLATLAGMPFDMLKIDRSFIVDIVGNAQSRALVEMILVLARQLRLTVVAEGVETAAQQVLLMHLGCGMVQGYLHAPPLPAAQFETLAFV